MYKVRPLLAIIVMLIMIVVNCSNVGNASTDERGNIYATGSSISDGSTRHDNIHSSPGTVLPDDIENSYEYWFDYYMLNDYGVQTDLSDWYHNQSYASSWDKYNIGTGGGQANTETGCSVYPYCCHPSLGEDAMYMACVPGQIDGVYGRAVWRYKNTDWSEVNYFIVESGVNEAMDRVYGINYLGSVWSGMYGIYNRSITYGFKFVILKTLPWSTSTYGYGNTAVGRAVIESVNAEKIKFASLHPDVILIDTFNTSLLTWSTPYTIWDYNPTYFQDTVHPNKAGYKILGKVIADALAPDILGLSPDTTELEFISIDGGDNGTEIYSPTPTFRWSATANTSYYRLQVSTSSSFSTTVVDITKINQYEYPSDCVATATYVDFTLPIAYSLSHGVYYCRVIDYR